MSHGYKCVFEAKPAKDNRPRVIYIAHMLALLIKVLVGYWLRVLRGQNNIATIDKYLRLFWQGQFRATHTALYVRGRNNLAPGKHYVLMSNHISLMDIVTIFAAFDGLSVRMIGKKELTKYPIFGQMLKRAGFITIDRQNRVKAIQQLEGAKSQLKKGISIWIAPEGTRSRTGELLPFRKGGFHIACALGVPIVPVFISGTDKVVPAKVLKVYPNHSIYVNIGKPISTQDVEKKDIPALLEKTRNAIIALKSARC